MAIVWLAFLVFPLAATLAAHQPAAQLVSILLAAALFVGLYLALVLNHVQPLADAKGLAWIGLLFAIATALTLVGPAAWASLFIFAAAAAAATLRERLALAAVVGCALLAAVSTLVAGAGAGAALGFTTGTAGIGLLVLSIADLRARNAELHHAREELARLAVADERLRFARDLHDLLGHSLSVIALKAELARRLLDGPQGVEVADACRHIGELEGVARNALSEVREAVSGYRRPVLAVELAGARTVLQAAGIEVQLDCAELVLAPEVEALLAWTVREGSTNVIRHSGARRCRVVLAADAKVASVEVHDDGCGPSGAPASLGEGDNAGAGNGGGDGGHAGYGLAGLRERAERLAGQMEVGAGPDGGYRLRVAVPSDPTGTAAT
jgi:two-component system, NarL family, sensor histidine kinase DesK